MKPETRNKLKSISTPTVATALFKRGFRTQAIQGVHPLSAMQESMVGEAFTLLQERAKVRSLTDDRIFPPSKLARKAECLDLRQPWEKVLKATGITDFHWHDLRHTAASYLAMSGVSLVEIAKVLGHRTLAMVARYSHLSDGHVVAVGEKLAARLGI